MVYRYQRMLQNPCNCLSLVLLLIRHFTSAMRCSTINLLWLIRTNKRVSIHSSVWAIHFFSILAALYVSLSHSSHVGHMKNSRDLTDAIMSHFACFLLMKNLIAMICTVHSILIILDMFRRSFRFVCLNDLLNHCCCCCIW